MKKIALLYFLPFLIALTVVYYFSQNRSLNSLLFQEESVIKSDRHKPFIENFRDNSYYEDFFLKPDSVETIFILGSSELTETSVALPYNFISKNFTTPLRGVGHAGNQCFSIYTQLLANEKKLKDARIVIILSPGWFESKSSRGTTSPLFLEFNSDNFLNRILTAEPQNDFHQYAYKGVSHFYNEFSSPSLEIKLMNFHHQASKSFIHYTLYAPLICFDNYLLQQKRKLIPYYYTPDELVEHPVIAPEPVHINWDSLYQTSKEEATKKATNNSLGIADDYYTQYIHGNTGRMDVVSPSFNQELKDFNVLIDLLKAKQANASFIISPLNPLYYKNLKDIDPTVVMLEDKLKQNHFPYLNLFTTDIRQYEKPILHDVMHMSDYGWYKVNRFIADTYKLPK